MCEEPLEAQSKSWVLLWSSPDLLSYEPKGLWSQFEKGKGEVTTVKEPRAPSASKYHTPGPFRVLVHLRKGISLTLAPPGLPVSLYCIRGQTQKVTEVFSALRPSVDQLIPFLPSQIDSSAQQ